jgi:putative ABC transport system permease protein
MRKVALRGLLAHKVRLIATFLAVALGVAFIGGVLTLTDTMNRSFDDLFADVYEGTDAVVRSDRTIGGDMGETRATIDAALLDRVREVDGVAAADGDVSGFARIIDRDGDPVGNPGFGPPTLGANWGANDALNPFTLREGRAPRADGEIVIDAASARSTGYRPGDTVPVQTKEGVDDLTLVGIAGFGSVDSPAGASYVMFTTAEAQRLLGEPGRFNDIAVVADEGVSQRAVAHAIETALGGTDHTEVLTGHQITEESQTDLRSQLSFVTSFFLAFALVAVIVGSFVIYNSFSIIVAQRTREMALLRAIGASRRQVRRAVLVEAVAVGLIGSVAGFVLGLGIASVLTGLLDVEGPLAIVPTSVVIAVLCGLVVTVASALIPARRASKVPPVAALRDVAIDRTGRSRVRFAVGLALCAVGAATVVSGANGEAAATVGLGVATALAGLLFAGPGLARPVSSLVGWPLGRLRGVTGVLARENAGRNPRRSASTAQALMIGVGIVAFFMVINSSIRASIDKTLDDNFAGDFIVDSGTFGMVGLPHDVSTRIAELPQVKEVAPLRYAPVEIGGDSTYVTGTDTAAFGIFGLDVLQGADTLGPGQVVVLKKTADDEGLAVGDTVNVDFLETGTTPLTVAGIYDGPPSTNLGGYVIGVDQMARDVPDTSDSQVMVELADGVTVDQARPAIERITDRYVSAEVQSVDDFKKSLGSQLDVFLNLVLGLLALAIVIAGLGIANTVALSVLERTRELGLLRAVGMTRRQLRATIRWESIIIALFGTVLGLAVGVLGGWGMVTAFQDEGFEVFQVPYGTIGLVAALAAVLGLIAALVPAWRASRLDVLAAIHSE